MAKTIQPSPEDKIIANSYYQLQKHLSLIAIGKIELSQQLLTEVNSEFKKLKREVKAQQTQLRDLIKKKRQLQETIAENQLHLEQAIKQNEQLAAQSSLMFQDDDKLANLAKETKACSTKIATHEDLIADSARQLSDLDIDIINQEMLIQTNTNCMQTIAPFLNEANLLPLALRYKSINLTERSGKTTIESYVRNSFPEKYEEEIDALTEEITTLNTKSLMELMQDLDKNLFSLRSHYKEIFSKNLPLLKSYNQQLNRLSFILTTLASYQKDKNREVFDEKFLNQLSDFNAEENHEFDPLLNSIKEILQPNYSYQSTSLAREAFELNAPNPSIKIDLEPYIKIFMQATETYLKHLDKAHYEPTIALSKKGIMQVGKETLLDANLSPLEKIQTFIRNLHTNEEALKTRRDNAFMTFLKSLGSLGKALYNSIKDSPFILNHFFAKTHGTKLIQTIKQAEEKLVAARVLK